MIRPVIYFTYEQLSSHVEKFRLPCAGHQYCPPTYSLLTVRGDDDGNGNNDKHADYTLLSPHGWRRTCAVDAVRGEGWYRYMHGNRGLRCRERRGSYVSQGEYLCVLLVGVSTGTLLVASPFAVSLKLINV